MIQAHESLQQVDQDAANSLRIDNSSAENGSFLAADASYVDTVVREE